MRAFPSPDVDVTHDTLVVFGRNQRPHIRLIHSRPDANLARTGDDFLQEGFADALLDQQARAGRADLAGIAVDALGNFGRGQVQVGVSKDDVGRLAAQFQDDGLDVDGGRLHDAPPGLDRAGEGDPVDVGLD